jgi:branched-chain amino acid transport system permease protein
MIAALMRTPEGLKQLTRAGMLLFAALALLPFFAPGDFVVTIAIQALSFMVLATGLNLIYGYTGLLSFAQVAFWGLGGYTSALLTVDLGMSPWLGLLAGALVAAVVSLVVGFAALRLSRHSFVIVTLSFALLLQLIARDWVDLTRGPMGIPGLPALQISLPGMGTFSSADPQVSYAFILVFTVAALAGVYRLVNSRIGRALVAIKHNEPLAQSQGINTLHYKLFAFGVSAALSAIAGGFFVFHLSIVDPTIFNFYYTEMSLIMVIIGGAGSFFGVLWASLFFTVIPELLRIGAELRMMGLGVLLILAVLLFPQGLGGYIRRLRFEQWRKEMR